MHDEDNDGGFPGESPGRGPATRVASRRSGATGRSGRGCQVRFRAHGRTAARRACSGGNSYVQGLKTGWHGICWISASFLCLSECT